MHTSPRSLLCGCTFSSFVSYTSPIRTWSLSAQGDVIERLQTSPIPDPVPVGPHTTSCRGHIRGGIHSPFARLTPVPLWDRALSQSLNPFKERIRARFWATCKVSTQRIIKKKKNQTTGSGRFTTFVSLLGERLDTCRLVALSPKPLAPKRRE